MPPTLQQICLLLKTIKQIICFIHKTNLFNKHYTSRSADGKPPVNTTAFPPLPHHFLFTGYIKHLYPYTHCKVLLLWLFCVNSEHCFDIFNSLDLLFDYFILSGLTLACFSTCSNMVTCWFPLKLFPLFHWLLRMNATLTFLRNTWSHPTVQTAAYAASVGSFTVIDSWRDSILILQPESRTSFVPFSPAHGRL